MKVKITKSCYVEGEPKKAGDIVDTKHGWLLIGSGKATQDISEPKKPKAKKAPANRQVEDVETR